jgi:hypothetical protein
VNLSISATSSKSAPHSIIIIITCFSSKQQHGKKNLHTAAGQSKDLFDPSQVHQTRCCNRLLLGAMHPLACLSLDTTTLLRVYMWLLTPPWPGLTPCDTL